MAIFPLQKPIAGKTLIETACHLYKLSIIRVLPISFVIVLIYHFMRFKNLYLPTQFAPLSLQISAGLLLLLLPIIGLLMKILDNKGKEIPVFYTQCIIYAAGRFLSLMGCLLSMLLLPAFALGICLGVYFLLGAYHFPPIVLMFWIGISQFILFASIVSNIFAPILVFTDEQDANKAVDYSGLLIKGFYWRTFGFCYMAFFLMFFIAILPVIINHYLPQSIQNMPIIVEAIAEILLVIIIPWSFALILANKYDLECRYNQTKAPLKK